MVYFSITGLSSTWLQTYNGNLHSTVNWLISDISDIPDILILSPFKSCIYVSSSVAGLSVNTLIAKFIMIHC